MADYEFRYSPLTGRLTGKQMIEQTEQAINQLSSLVDSAAGQVEIISTLANKANENAATALETAEEALATTGRTYITVSTQADANDYYDSQLIYIADNTSTNIPVADTGMLEVKTNDNKTACEQCFVADSSGASYYRHGDITAETVGDVTTYTVTWGGWSSEPASQAYVQGELENYLPLSGGTVTGGLTVEGTVAGNLTGNVTGNADTATNATNATNDANGNPIAGTYLPLAGGTMTGNIIMNADTSISAFADNQNVGINGGSAWEKGAWLSVWGKDHATYPGWFSLHANNGTNDYVFVGKPNGTLTWNNKPVMIKGVENGHGIQTGEVTGITVNAGSYKQGSVTFNTPFGGTPIVTATYSRGYTKMYVSIYSISSTGFGYTLTNDRDSQETGQSFTWIAIL